MCGRYRNTLSDEAMRALVRYLNEIANIRPRYNAAPTDMLPVVRLDPQRRRELVMMRWGLIPSWAKDTKIGAKFINARAETVATQPAFRDAFRARRCLVPSDGFYEWKKAPDGTKQPYHIGMRDGAAFAFAGLWEHWTRGPAPIESFTIITGPPNSLVAELHDRMPVILEPDHYEEWLTATDTAALETMLQPFPAQLMAAYPVSTKVNSVKNDTPDLIEPIALDSDDRLI
jgi:putative SOS response-associated peptidase YedK